MIKREEKREITQVEGVTFGVTISNVDSEELDTVQQSLDERALMSRLWTGFFGTGRYRTPKIFQNPDFSLKRRDFWVFL